MPKQADQALHTLSLRELNRATLARQMLLKREKVSVVEAVERLAGMQAQYSPSPYIGLWSRVAGFKLGDLEGALKDREVIKASLIRWTLHLASARDYPFFSTAITDARLTNWNSIIKRLGVDMDKLHAQLLEYASEPRTQREMHEFVRKQAPHTTEEQRELWHIATAPGWFVHVPPSGLWRYFGKNSYTSAHEWLGNIEKPSLEDSMVHLVRRYLAAFGPASRADVVSWAGLRRVSLVDGAITTLGDKIISFKDEKGRTLYDLATSPRPGSDVPAPVRYLPKWDNLLLAYDKRDRTLPDRYRKTVIRKNGDVLPTFLVDGVVAGMWTIAVERKQAVLSLEAFEPLAPSTRADLEEEGMRLAAFVEPEATEHVVCFAS